MHATHPITDHREPAIEVRHVSKRYPVPRSAGNGSFLALDDVSFTLYRGDVLGIIGSNGSGKSTLLKILGEITKPTSGEVRFYGSVTSILNIGDNFHPDLSGRENVGLHLKLRGVPSARFAAVQNEIERFSEIGDFFDRPVKSYSDGMFLRLAFSVALNLECDILLLDEVLSVGDEGFRLKCQELLRTFAESGKTILFVSHNRSEILELANRCLWLEKGRIRRVGDAPGVLSEYFTMHRERFDAQRLVVDTDPHWPEGHNEDGAIHLEWNAEDAPGNDILSIRRLSVSSLRGQGPIFHSEPLCLRFWVLKKKPGIHIGAFFFLQDVFYQPVMVGHFLNNSGNQDFTGRLKEETGLIEITCTVPAHFLAPGKYYLLPRFGMEENTWSTTSTEAFRFSEKLSFVVQAETGYVDFIGDIGKGSVRPPLDWEIKKVD